MVNAEVSQSSGCACCGRVRIALLVLLLSLHEFTPASAAEKCAVVDLMPPFWQALAGSDPAAQMRTSVVEPYPDLYNDKFVRLAQGAAWQLELAHEKAYAEAHRTEIDATEQYLAANAPHFMQEFRKTFPDYRCNFTFYIAPSFGHMDGSAVIVNGQYRIIFAPDVIPRLHTLSELKVLIDHETFHILHRQVTGVFGVDEEAVPTIEAALWSEGLATLVSWRMNPGVSLDVALLQPGIPERARAYLPALATGLLMRLEDKDPSTYDRYFAGGQLPDGYPARAGYYVGLLLAQDLSKRYTLRQLARLTGPALHSAIVSGLQQLREPTGAGSDAPTAP